MNHPSVTDSVWYWVQLFCIGGVAALVLMEPKFAPRQAQIELKSLGRQRAAQHMSGQSPEEQLAVPQTTAITLWPLYAVLGILICIAWLNLWRGRLRRSKPPES